MGAAADSAAMEEGGGRVSASTVSNASVLLTVLEKEGGAATAVAWDECALQDWRSAKELSLLMLPDAARVGWSVCTGGCVCAVGLGDIQVLECLAPAIVGE